MHTFFNWQLVVSYFPQILSALPVTLIIVAIASVIGILLGAVIGFIRIEKVPGLNQIGVIFVSFIRGTPILVQLYLVYYGAPALLSLIGIDAQQWNKLYFLFITYGLNTAAFQSETIRAAFLSVPALQKEACLACGFTKRQTYLKVIIPQAVRVAIPSFSTITISLLQDTSLAFTIGVVDVVGKAKAIGTSTFHTMEGYVDAAIIFIVLSFILEKAFAYLAKRMTIQDQLATAPKPSFFKFNHHANTVPNEMLTETPIPPTYVNKPEGSSNHAEKI